MADEENNKTPEEILKDEPKYPERAAEEDEKEDLMSGVYRGPAAPEMAAVYMGPPDANIPATQMVYMGPPDANNPATQMAYMGPVMFMAYAGPAFNTGVPINGLEHVVMGKGYTPDPKSKFCENCGAKNPKDGKFCETCGEKFKE